MSYKKLVYVLNNFKINKAAHKTIHGCSHRNKIKKPFWQNQPFSKFLLSRKVAETNYFSWIEITVTAYRLKCPYSELFWSDFPAFGLNMERYKVSVRIQCECRKIRTRIITNTDTFYAVYVLELAVICKLLVFLCLVQNLKFRNSPPEVI